MTHKGYRCVKVEEPVAGVLKVVLARPKHLNAVNGDMIDDLLSLSDEIVSGYPDRYRAIVLSGEGRAFCSGGDIDFFRTLLGEPKNAVESVIARFHRFARIWYQLPLPTIAVLSGVAAGGGAALALLCDIRYAAPDAKIGFSFVNIGLVPDFGTHFLLPALAGMDKALELMYTGDFVSAEEAARIGLITRIFPRESAESEAVALAARLAGKSPYVLRSIKKLSGEARNLSLTEVLAREVETQAGRFKTPEFEAHVRDFLARR